MFKVEKRYFVCFVKTRSCKPGSKGFIMTRSEEGECTRIRESTESTDKRREGATVKASKM